MISSICSLKTVSNCSASWIILYKQSGEQKPIISSVDGQTSGGYPRIANVISADLSILGQLKSGDKVRFSLIEKELARDIVIEKQARLDLHIKD